MDYATIVVKWRWFIIRNCFFVGVIAVIVSLLLPKWYQSTAVIMPPTENSSLGFNVSALLSKIPLGGLGIGLPGMQSEQSQIFMAILKSRTLREKIIKKYDLMGFYESEDIEEALETLDEKLEIEFGDEGQLAISFLDRTPERAAEITADFVAGLDSINTALNVQKAREDRLFIEKRFEQNKNDLRLAEEKLKEFQQKHGVVDIPEQTRAAISSAAQLQSEIYATEIELNMKRKHLSPQHVEVRQTRELLMEYRKKLAELKSGNSHSADDDLFIPFEAVPDVGLDYLRLYREVEIQNTLFELLIQLYEQAKIEEAKDIPSLQILDPPSIPIKKTKPKRTLIVLLCGLLAMFVSLTYAFASESMQKIEKEEGKDSSNLGWIKKELQGDLARLKRKKNR